MSFGCTLVLLQLVQCWQNKGNRVNQPESHMTFYKEEEKHDTMLQLFMSWESKSRHRVCELKHLNGISGET